MVFCHKKKERFVQGCKMIRTKFRDLPVVCRCGGTGTFFTMLSYRNFQVCSRIIDYGSLQRANKMSDWNNHCLSFTSCLLTRSISYQWFLSKPVTLQILRITYYWKVLQKRAVNVSRNLISNISHPWICVLFVFFGIPVD